MHKANAAIGSLVCVIGLGLSGQLIVQLAKLNGCIVIAIDHDKERLVCAQAYGADYTFDIENVDLEAEIGFITHHYGVDAAIIADELYIEPMLKKAVSYTRKEGKIICIMDGNFSLGALVLERNEIDICLVSSTIVDQHFKQPSFSTNYLSMMPAYNKNMQIFLSLINQRRISVERFFKHELFLDSTPEEYKSKLKGGSFGALLHYKNQPHFVALSQSQDKNTEFLGAHLYKNEVKMNFIATVKDNRIGIGCVGVHSPLLDNIIPSLSTMTTVSIKSIIDKDLGVARDFARYYGIDHVSTIYEDLLSAEDIQVIILASAHKLHANHVLKALQSGKAVLLEEPMATSPEQLNELKNILEIIIRRLYV